MKYRIITHPGGFVPQYKKWYHFTFHNILGGRNVNGLDCNVLINMGKWLAENWRQPFKQEVIWKG